MIVQHQGATMMYLVILVLLFNTFSVGSVTDPCGGRCDDDKHVYCHNGVCEACDVYCLLASHFASLSGCQLHCPYIIYGTNQTRECPQTCDPGFYCEKDLQACESCEGCDPEFKPLTKKCPESCAAPSVQPSSESEIPVTEKRGKNNKTLHISLYVGLPCLVVLAIVVVCVTVFLCKRGCRKIPYPVQATATEVYTEHFGGAQV